MKKVTITDVARLSGFGVATVSRVIHGDKSVKKSTRDAINKVIEDLHYTPDINGVRLQRGRSYVIAVMVPLINHPFFSQFVEDAEEAASKKGYSVLLVTSKMHVEKEREILAFVPEEYWSIIANFSEFSADLDTFDHKELKINNKSEADKVLSSLGNEFTVLSVEQSSNIKTSVG